jgi:hypothetical protein
MVALDGARLLEQRFETFEGIVAGTEDADPVVAAVDGMRHQPIQCG